MQRWAMPSFMSHSVSFYYKSQCWFFFKGPVSVHQSLQGGAEALLNSLHSVVLVKWYAATNLCQFLKTDNFQEFSELVMKPLVE